MKNFITFCVITVIMTITPSCQYDDTNVVNRISALEERVNAVEALLKASANNLTIVSVVDTDEGIVITFSDGSKITIGNQSDGNSPITNVHEDGDMVYITLDNGTVLVFRRYEFDENCKIYYTTTDDKILFCDEGFGAILISSTFENSQGLLIFDNPVTSSGAYKSNERLKSIVLPNTVETMESYYGCTGLRELYCKAITPPTANAGFLSKYGGVQGHTPLGCKIYVPKESLEMYKAAKYWSDYADKIVGYDFR